MSQNTNQQQEKSNLELYTQDLVQIASEGKLDPVLNRDAEIGRLVRILARRQKNNPVLIGEPGTGKSAIVEGLAQRILRGDVTKNLEGAKIYSLDMALLVAGSQFRGQFEEKLKGLMKELKEKAENGEPCVLFIDEIHLVLGAGKGEGAMDAANIMKPELSRATSGLRVIGATTLNEYRQYMEKDAAFERRFQKVMVNEPSVEATVSILRGLKEKYETFHGVRISDAALVTAAQLSDRYIQGRYQPDKSIDLIDEACAKCRVSLDSQPEIIDTLERRQLQLKIEETAMKSEKDAQSKKRLKVIEQELASIEEQLTPLKKRYEFEKSRVSDVQALQKKLDSLKIKLEMANRQRDLQQVADLQYYAIPQVEEKLRQAEIDQKRNMEQDEEEQLLTENVGVEEIYDIISGATGIPVSKLSQSDREKILNLESTLKERIVGQDEALKSISQAILRSRAGLNRADQPTGSFLLLGPTGTGKTETSKAIADTLFNDEKMMTRIDMSEYMEAHSVSRMIGSPPGYIGHEEGGQLTEAIRRHPYNLILFDEIEKAHPQVLNILLQVLDDGRLTDGQGRVVNFSNTVIIMTSNIGAEHLMGDNVADFNGNLNPVVKENVLQSCRDHFRPELLNRMDDILVFKPLSKMDLCRIVELQIKLIATRLKDREIDLVPSQLALEYILNESYNPSYGARPVKRYLETNLVTQISRLIMQGVCPNQSKVYIDVSANASELTYHVERKIISSDENSMEI